MLLGCSSVQLRKSTVPIKVGAVLRRPALAFADNQKSAAQVDLRRGPFERGPFTGQFHEGVAIGGDRLFKLCGPGCALSQNPERVAEIVLGRCPLKWHAVSGPLPQRFSISGDGLFKFRGFALPFADGSERNT